MAERAGRLDPSCDYLISTDFPVVAAYCLENSLTKSLEMLTQKFARWIAGKARPSGFLLPWNWKPKFMTRERRLLSTLLTFGEIRAFSPRCFHVAAHPRVLSDP
jgi:hypothetical protein